ncbi:MAG: L-threonylcarbamoyladenylate synthase [Planctomycetota bacterium]|jgi:L-threonylcarbamoyladenylate synthase
MPRVVEPTRAAIEEAATRLRAGQVVVFPTETVYGLGADTFNVLAVRLVYAMKGRALDNPLIAHVVDAAQAATIVVGWDARCATLAERFWPGPLTLVLPRGERVPARATAGHPTIAVRCPRHAVARRLLEAFGGPVSAPSANRSGHVSPTTAGHVAQEFADEDDLLVLDGGPCEVGIESTVLDLAADRPRILRPGSVTALELAELLGEIDAPELRGQDRGPGTTMAHYAPRTPAVLLDRAALATHLQQATDSGRRLAVLCFDPAAVMPPHRAFAMPQSAGDYAKVLYDALRRADDVGASEIAIERPPLSNEMWRAVLDRLVRATAR